MTIGKMKVAVVLIALATASGSDAVAQAEHRQVQVRGRVVDSLSRNPVAGATVEVGENGLRQTTDSSGRFIAAEVPLGRQVLRVRHIGYEETIDTIEVEAGEHGERRLTLRRLPTELSETIVAGRAVRYPAFFEAAYKRASRGRGFFITREEIEASSTSDYQSLLNKVPGVSANDRGVTFQRCQAGLEAVSDPSIKPKLQVLIDGRIAARGDASSIYDVLRSVNPHSIQLMEIYPSVASIPAEFLSDACAVIVIWTKRN
jgi:TonB-dependent starch-binding outer membrane protein SusC